MAGRRGLLAFCMFARHVAVVVERLLLLRRPVLGDTRGLRDSALAIGACWPWVKGARRAGGHWSTQSQFLMPQK
jgi:hypothetical protein